MARGHQLCVPSSLEAAWRHIQQGKGRPSFCCWDSHPTAGSGPTTTPLSIQSKPQPCAERGVGCEVGLIPSLKEEGKVSTHPDQVEETALRFVISGANTRGRIPMGRDGAFC